MTEIPDFSDRRVDEIQEFIVECGVAFYHCLGSEEAVAYLISKRIPEKTVQRVVNGRVRKMLVETLNADVRK